MTPLGKTHLSKDVKVRGEICMASNRKCILGGGTTSVEAQMWAQAWLA